MRILLLAVVVAQLAAAETTIPWHHQHPADGGAEGTGTAKAHAAFTLVPPPEPILVAVIDTGIDLEHPDLADRIWVNPGERGGKVGVDDDGNGWIDDLQGWNFLGSRDGRRQVGPTSLEVARERRRLLHLVAQGTATEADRAALRQVARDLGHRRREALTAILGVAALVDQMDAAAIRLAEAGVDPEDHEAVAAVAAGTTALAGAARTLVQWREVGVDGKSMDAAQRGSVMALAYHLDGRHDPAAIIGDDPADLVERGYGNPWVDVENAHHGTHVAGIIAGRRDGSGAEGHGEWIRILPLVAIPDGDERDKDVAQAIVFAVEAGARIICCSFGKDYAPDYAAVMAAARLAEERGVLIVHAAGNDGADVDRRTRFPNPWIEDQGQRRRLRTWIEVGASGPGKDGEGLIAPFSNRGRETVDLFAPGVEIVSSVPGGGSEPSSGTSMAAPNVAGVAALILSQHPDLDGAALRDLLLRTARRPVRPADATALEAACLSGGLVDAWAALASLAAGDE